MEYYFVSYVSKTHLSSILDEQAKKLTHLNIAFAPVKNGETIMELTEDELKQLKFQHTALFKKYREELNKLEKIKNRHFWLTTAAGCGQWYIDRTEISKSHKYLDFINLMTYDSNTNTSVTGHHTHLFNSKQENATKNQSADYHINLLKNAGVPIEKILIGVAFYSHKWENVENINNGLYQKSPKNNFYGEGYGEILEKYENGSSNFIKFFDEDAKAPYLFNGNTFISYDDPVSTKYKIEYAKENGLKGAFYWVHQADKTGTLFNVMYENLFLK